jgi:dihydrofolate reductase
MSKLIYAAITSLDGYIEDTDGRFDWATPDAEVHSFINDIEATIGSHLYGRRMYETMAAWQAVGNTPEVHRAEAEYGELWRRLDKIAYSQTLDKIWTPRTLLHRDFDPEAVRRLKDAADRDMSVSGPGLAQHAFAAGLVDEIHLFVYPVVVGGGKAALPRNVQMKLELLNERQFESGAVHLHHRIR